MRPGSLAEAVRRELPEDQRDGVIVVYDGKCPVCTAFSNYVALRDRYAVVRLLDARTTPDLVARLRKAGWDLDRDFAIVRGDEITFGAEGMRTLSSMDWKSKGLTRFLKGFFGRPGRGARLYRTMNFGRRVLLRILGRPAL